MLSRRSRFLGFACVLSDSMPTALAFVLAYGIRFWAGQRGFLPVIYPFSVYVPLFLASLLVFPFVGYLVGAYRYVDRRPVREIVNDVVKITSWGFLILFTGLFLLKWHFVSRTFLLGFAVLHFLLLGVGRWIFLFGDSHFRNRHDQCRHFIVVGTGVSGARLASLLEQGERFGLRLLAFVGTSDGDLSAPPGLRGSYPHVPLLTFASSPQNEGGMLLKRALDFVMAGVVLVLLSPLFLILALVVRLTSPGPVFYRQTRCGLGGRRFSLLKFRSMAVDAEDSQSHLEDLNEVDGPVFKMRDDPRCTTVGRWIRVFSLDELPQLWNVLCGDMSLVGPRPPLPREVQQYEPWQRKRLCMRPGMTCLWALEGRSQLRFDRWVKLDLLYIDRWSIWLDFKILFKTIPAVLSGKGAH